MKKIYVLFLIIFLFTINVNALKSTSSDLKNRNVCSNFELAVAMEDDSISKVSCYDSYDAAKKAMDEGEDKDLIILQRVSGVTKVIDAKNALVYLDRGDTLTYVYNSSSVTTDITYMNNASTYGATDGALISLNYSNKAVKIKIGGVVGWIKNGNYTIIPLAWVKSASYYKISNDGITHYYAKNIETSGYSRSYRTLGPKPSNIENGSYFSYDGNYFYMNLYDLVDDYKNNSHEKSINSTPYYNYYLYLPHRSKSNYSIDDIDVYLRNVKGFKGSIYGKTLVDNYSVIYGTSEYFMYAEKMYGANAVSIMSLSFNESAFGRSSIAYNKNNIFGHNAVDGSAYSSATGYLDVRSSIYSHAYGYINYGYNNTNDYRYHGGHFGNKGSGMNVMYASDVFWGEKAANYYYWFDHDNGMLDYNYYQLIMSNQSNIKVQTTPSTSSSSPYKIPQNGATFILLEEVHGEMINDNDIWYKIQSDNNINNNGSLIASNKSTWPEYNWNGYVYVHSSYFNKINETESIDGVYKYPSQVDKEINDYTLTTYATKTKYEPKVGVISSDKDYYYSSTLLNKKGTIKKDSIVVILEEVKENDHIVYQIITDFGKYQKAWIDSENVTLKNYDLLNVTMTNSGGYISIYDKVGGKEVLKSYANNFLPIVDKVESNNKVYLKVEYKIDGSILYGYADATSNVNNISYTTKYLNKAPTLTASDITIYIENPFNPLDYAKGTDPEDGDITKNIIVSENNVDINYPGTYSVTYSLTDSYGATVTKKVNVKVLPRAITDALFMYDSLKYETNDKFTISGFMGIKGMDNINPVNKLIFVNELTKKEYEFNLSKWEDYPYEMKSLDDKQSYNYSGGWFKNTIDLSTIPNGNYTLYVSTINGNKEAKTLFTNIAYMDMTRRANGEKHDYSIDIDYSTLNSPLIFSIRDSLISLDEPNTVDPMYNFFNSFSLSSNTLKIKGTSHNIGVSYGLSDEIERKIVFENMDNFSLYEMDLGSIDNGDYPITLSVSDNCDKTRAWYDKSIDLKELPVGKYIVYIKNKVNNKTFYGEIIDVMYTDFSQINNDKYEFRRNDDIRLRLELTVKE